MKHSSNLNVGDLVRTKLVAQFRNGDSYIVIDPTNVGIILDITQEYFNANGREHDFEVCCLFKNKIAWWTDDEIELAV